MRPWARPTILISLICTRQRANPSRRIQPQYRSAIPKLARGRRPRASSAPRDRLPDQRRQAELGANIGETGHEERPLLHPLLDRAAGAARLVRARPIATKARPEQYDAEIDGYLGMSVRLGSLGVLACLFIRLQIAKAR